MARSVIVGVVAVAAIVLAAGFWQWNSETNNEEPTLTSAGPNPTSEATAVLEQPVAEGGPAVDPVSLPAFANQDFVGSDFKVGRVLAETPTYTRYYITYKSGELTISGIMNVPKASPPAGGWPLLLLNHGHISPLVYTNGRGLKREQDYLARHGYVVVHSDYRNHADSDNDPVADEEFRLVYAEDVINAIHAVKAANLSYIDTDHIGMLGHSMGGGVSWRIAVTQPELVDAYVQFAPVSADERDNFAKWTTRRPLIAGLILGKHGEPSKNPSFWDNISPITFMDQVAAPILIHHGTADDSVPLEWSERATEALKAAGKDVTLRVYPGEPHEFTTAWPRVMAETTDFFDQHLKN